MRHIKTGFLALIAALTIVSCIKHEFDEPPVGDCNANSITENTTIKALKALRVSIGVPDSITGDVIIKGVVISNDRPGNFYKTLVIQDGTAGIEVKMDNGFLYQKYPVGRTVFIRCQGLLLSDYNGVIQLLGSAVQQGGQFEEFGLTEAQERRKVVAGCTGAAPTPRTVTIDDLTGANHRDLISTLIKLDEVQFTQCDAERSWADPVTQNSLNRELENCSGRKVLVRTSGFADFAAALTPKGKGSLTAVFSVYNSDKQLYIRDLDDAKMSGERCKIDQPGGSSVTAMRIADLRAQFTGTTTAAPASRKITGIVISDRIANNLNARNLYLQDGASGIVVRFLNNHCFDLGDEIEVVVSGMELSEFNKLLQVNNVPLANAALISRGKTPAVREATIADINANFNAWESTLVRVKNASITGGATLSGNRTVDDGTGNIPMFTQSAASFSGFTTPATKVTLTAIVSDFNGKQIILRNANDILR